MKNKLAILIILVLLSLLGGFLRFYDNPNTPPGLNIDEVAFGYNAFSILKTGRDENGVFLPITFSSYGDYKNPVPIYFLVPIVALFGLNDFSVRFLTAAISTLTIPIFFFFIKYLTKNNYFSMLATTLLSISAWHIYYSRILHEHPIATLFIILGVWSLLKMLDGNKWLGIISAFFLSLSLYTYFAERLFTPMFVFFILIYNYKKVRRNILPFGLFCLTCLLLSIPLLYVSIFGQASSRAAAIILTKDIDYQRYVQVGNSNNFGEFFLLIFYWVQRYLNYLQPDFLFFTGLNMTNPGTLGLGILYLTQLPFFILGLIELIKRKLPYKYIIIGWILIGIFPASLTTDQRNSSRLIMILPAIIFVLSLGVIKFVKILRDIKFNFLKYGITTAVIFLILIDLGQAFLIFNIHFPRHKGEAFMEGTKQSVMYALTHKDSYNEIIFDPDRGVEGPNIVNVPHAYVIFYSQFDPNLYQSIRKNLRASDSGYIFDKYTIRKINWIEDKHLKKTLFIGSPWNFAEAELKEGELLEKVKMRSGQTVLHIVSPK